MCYEQLTLQATEQVEQPQSEREAEQARLVFDVKTSQVDERTKSWPGQKPAETMAAKTVANIKRLQVRCNIWLSLVWR